MSHHPWPLSLAFLNDSSCPILGLDPFLISKSLIPRFAILTSLASETSVSVDICLTSPLCPRSGDSHFIYVYSAMELDFSGRHLGSGTSDSAGITIHFSLFQVGFITTISWNWPSIGPLCFLSLQTLKERTS
uniref:Uncharacterized protein n=1 Tax=Macaca mulatta TaxID=9544 RepID=A0A5F8AUE6_MACMU